VLLARQTPERETSPVPTGVATAGDGSQATEAELGPGARAPGEEARARRRDRALLAVVLAAVNMPILVATSRALARGWQPLGDDALVVVRARDVGTSHHPLLGLWTSASVVVGDHVNNPGPLYFEAIAPAVRLFGPWVGLAVGAMLVNMASSSLAVVAARRINGAETMLAVALAVVGLELALGSELLFDVWPANAAVLPFFAFLVVSAALAAGDLAMAPWMAGVGSLMVHTHISYVPIVAITILVSAVLAAANLHHRRERPAWRRPAAWTAVVLVLAWIQPLIEQVAGPGEGNLSRIAGAAVGGDGPTYGPELAGRLVAEVVGSPWFTRSSYGSAVPSGVAVDDVDGLVPFPGAAVLCALILSALLASAVVAWRSGRAPVATLLASSAAVLAGAIVALATSPVSVLGVTSHQMRWLWPVAAFATAALLSAGLAAARAHGRAAAPVLAVGAAAVVAVAAAGLATSPRGPGDHGVGPAEDAGQLRQAQALVNRLDVLRDRGPIRFDNTGLRFAEPFSGLVFAELQDLGVPIVFTDEVTIRHLGEERRDTGGARYSLREALGPEAYAVPAGAERIALVDGLTAAERSELRAIERRARDGRPVPGDADRAAVLERRMREGAVALFVEPLP
jgi:hypothetical protein